MSLPDLSHQLQSVRSVLPLVTQCRPHELPQWDETARYTLSLPAHQVWTSYGWYGVQLPPDWWSLWQPLMQREPELLHVMACAPSGHVRWRACQELRKRPTLRSLALLLVRSNDWVQDVRDAARSALHMLINPAPAAGVIRPLLLELSGTLSRGRRATPIMKG